MCVNGLRDVIACGHGNYVFLFIQVSILLCVSGDLHLGCFLIQQYKYQCLKTGKNPHEMMAQLMLPESVVSLFDRAHVTVSPTVILNYVRPGE